MTDHFDLLDRIPLLATLDGLAPTVRALPASQRRRCERAWRRARSFARTELYPRSEQHDRAMDRDHAHVDHPLVTTMARAGLLSMCCFRSLGGSGLGGTGSALAIEELSAACAGLANIVGAHQLGLLGVMFSRNLALSRAIQIEVAQGDARGKPVVLAAAVTEPQAGSDVEDPHHMETARICTSATRCDDGYLLSGTKVFISNGSFARWVLVGAATDRSRPRETWTLFLVDSRSPGFSVARVEHKMGMRANPAAELSLDEVFVPGTHMLSDCVGDGMAQTEVVLAASRGPVGAIATGIARGALERFLRWATSDVHKVAPIRNAAVQERIGAWIEQLSAARATYLAATISFDKLGFGALAGTPVVELYGMPGAGLATEFFSRSERRRTWLGGVLTSSWAGDTNDRALATSSLAKRSCSDTAMTVIADIMNTMGADALDPDWGVEKCWRDARLTQIYEGTNEVNRLCLYDKGVQL